MIEIEILELEEDVYDIQVEDNHNFFANGILVHNCEILIPHTPLDGSEGENEIGACILSNCNLGYSKNEEIPKVAEYLVNFLDNLIDYSSYSQKEIEYAAKKRRTLGIGISNLFGYLAKSKQFYNLKETRKNIQEISELFYYSLLKASIQLAKEKGPCELYKDTKYADGYLQFEEYNLEFPLVLGDKWNEIKEDLKKYGIRNSVLAAVPPSANCLFFKEKIRTYEGNFNIEDICKRENIDFDKLSVGWYDLKNPISLPTKDGDSVSERFYYNGEEEVFEITLENGDTITATKNHKLFVKRNNEYKWVKIKDIKENDDILHNQEIK